MHLQSAAAEMGQELVLVGDPGCLATVAERLDAKYAIGSAVGVANGISRAGIAGRAVALFGDSSFFHTTIPAICNAVVQSQRHPDDRPGQSSDGDLGLPAQSRRGTRCARASGTRAQYRAHRRGLRCPVCAGGQRG